MLYNKQKYSIFFKLILILVIIDNTVLRTNGRNHNFTFIYRDYLRKMVNIMDGTVEPCENFFQHACGNFDKLNKTSELSQEDASKENHAYEMDQDVAPFLYNKQDYYRFFESNKQDFETIPGLMVRKLYDLCKSTEQKNAGKRRKWLRMINEIPFLKHDQDLLKKWPFLQYQWESYEQQLDLNWPALAAEFTAHGLKMFFHIFFAQNTIYITANDELKCPDLINVKASLKPFLRHRNIQIAEVIGGELWLFCRQLKGEVALSNEINEETNPLFDDTMSDFFQRLFPRLNFSDIDIEKSRKIPINIGRLSDVMSVLRSTNSRIIYNFIVWLAYDQINTEDCFALTDEFQNLLHVEYWQWSVLQAQFSRDVALATFLFHSTRFQNFYRQIIISSSWERLFQHRSQRKDLNIERSIKNHVKQFVNLDSYSKVFKSELFAVTKPSYYALLLEMRRLSQRYAFLNPYDDLEDMSFFQEFLSFSILLFYRPRLHYFASYDREMWQNSKLLQNSDGFYTALDCLPRQTAFNMQDSSLYVYLSDDQMEEIFNFYTAFMAALADYKFWLESENFAIAEDFIFEYFQLDSRRIMFYAVAQQYCSRNDLLYATLINRSYMNMPEFQDAFQCSNSDAMNPLMKCMINQCF